MGDRVLFVVESTRPSGLNSQAVAIARPLVDHGIDPVWCVLDRLPADNDPAVNRLPSCGRRWAVDPLALARLRRLVREFAPRVVHAWGATPAAYAASAGGGAKVVATVGRSEPNPPSWRRWLTGNWRRRVDRVVTPSHAVAESLADEGAGEVAVVPPGVDADPETNRHAARKDVFEELSLPAGAKVIVIAGPMLPRKRVEELIWCADLLRVVRDEIRLLVIGDGPQLPALVRFARMASDLEHVRLLGQRHDVQRLLAAADVFWHAGDELSPPLAILEAMAAGVPVVADHTPGASLAITDGETGRLIAPGARADRARTTEQLLTEPELATRFAAAAKSRVTERFSADRAASDYAEIYRTL